MKVVKKTKDYVIYQKGSGRYAIKGADKNWINADEKIKIYWLKNLLKQQFQRLKSRKHQLKSLQ